MRLLQVGQDWIRRILFTSDGETIIVADGTERHNLRLHWHHLRDAKTARTWPIPLNDFALSPDFSVVAQPEMEVLLTGWEEALHIRNLHSPDTAIWRIPLRSAISSLAFSPDGQTLFIGCFRMDESYEPECEIRRYDLQNEIELPQLPARAKVKAITMTRRGDRLITGGDDNRVRIWQYPEHQQLAEWPHKNSIHHVVLSPDERILASVAGRSAALWDMNENRQIVRLTTHAAPVSDLAFSADGRTLATACLDGAMRLWDVATGQQRQAFDWNIGRAGAVAFSQDGLTIAAGGEQGRVVIWDVDA
jgi:WD40 repeat protein